MKSKSFLSIEFLSFKRSLNHFLIFKMIHLLLFLSGNRCCVFPFKAMRQRCTQTLPSQTLFDSSHSIIHIAEQIKSFKTCWSNSNSLLGLENLSVSLLQLWCFVEGEDSLHLVSLRSNLFWKKHRTFSDDMHVPSSKKQLSFESESVPSWFPKWRTKVFLWRRHRSRLIWWLSCISGKVKWDNFAAGYERSWQAEKLKPRLILLFAERWNFFDFEVYFWMRNTAESEVHLRKIKKSSPI